MGKSPNNNYDFQVSDKERLRDYDEAMRRIKDATGVSDVNEII